MSCGCNDCNDPSCNGGCSDSCNPCNQVINTESLASSLLNLITQLFGTFTKTTVNGRSVWTSLCSPNTNGIACFPKSVDEGFICYFLRIMTEIGLFNGGTWDSGIAYCPNTIVGDGNGIFVSILAVPAGTPTSNTTYWSLLLTAAAGATGPQGPPGASGAGSAVNYATQVATTDVTLTDTGAVVFCHPAAPMVVNLPDISLALAGKWFKIWTNGAASVTITPNGADTVNGAASYVLNTANQSVELVAYNAGTDWRIF